MAISRNWKAISFDGVAGPEIKVNAEVNTGMLTVMPELTKRGVLESFPGVLELNLLNASDAAHEHFLPVQYNEKIPSVKEYGSVQIFYKDQLIKSIKVEIV